MHPSDLLRGRREQGLADLPVKVLRHGFEVREVAHSHVDAGLERGRVDRRNIMGSGIPLPARISSSIINLLSVCLLLLIYNTVRNILIM